MKERHPYELFCQLEDIEHRTTKVRSPRTNGFVERMNRTLLDECFRVKGRETWYTSTDEIRRDLDQFIEYYNLRRSHQGHGLSGRTGTGVVQSVRRRSAATGHCGCGRQPKTAQFLSTIPVCHLINIPA